MGVGAMGVGATATVAAPVVSWKVVVLVTAPAGVTTVVLTCVTVMFWPPSPSVLSFCSSWPAVVLVTMVPLASGTVTLTMAREMFWGLMVVVVVVVVLEPAALATDSALRLGGVDTTMAL